MIYRVKTVVQPNLRLYYKARFIEFLTPTFIFTIAIALSLLIWKSLSIFIAGAYLVLLFVWILLAILNRPITKRWQESLPGTPVPGVDVPPMSFEPLLWNFYAQIVGQMRAARYVEVAETVIYLTAEKPDNAALYIHPFISLFRAPKFLLRLFKFDDYCLYLTTASTRVLLQYPDLYFSGSYAAWRKIMPKLPLVIKLREQARQARNDKNEAHRRRMEYIGEIEQSPLKASVPKAKIDAASANEASALTRLAAIHQRMSLIDEALLEE